MILNLFLLLALVLGEDCYVCKNVKREIKSQFLQNEQPTPGRYNLCFSQA